MATYGWETDLSNYKQQADQVLVTGRQSYDVVVRGAQLMSMANEAMGTLVEFEGQFQGAIDMIDSAIGVLDDIAGFANFCIETLDTIVSEITSFVQAFVQAFIDEVFNQLQDLYDSILDSIEEATDVDVEALMALAPLAGQLLDQAFSLLPASLVGDAAAKIGNFKKYLDVAASLGNFNSLMRNVALSNVMGQVNEIMGYVNLNNWIPDAAKGVLSTRFAGFKERNYVTDDGKPHFRNIFNRKIFNPANPEAVIIEEAIRNRAADNVEKNITELEKLTYGMDPRCMDCTVDNSSEFTVY
jgi:hypothetical protein